MKWKGKINFDTRPEQQSNKLLSEGADEFGDVAEKVTPVSADRILIEDSADSNNKKFAQIGNLPGGGGSGDVVGPSGGVVDTEIAAYDGTTGKLIQGTGMTARTTAGGSFLGLDEHATTPGSPNAGEIWIEAVDANTKVLKYFDGSSTYGVQLTKE